MNLTKARLSEYVNGLSVLADAAKAELSNGLWEVWQATGHDMDMLHDAVNMLAPPIAAKYGKASSTLAAELWEEIYRHDRGRSAMAVLDDEDDTHLFGASSGYAFRDGAATDPDQAVAHVMGTMGRAVLNHARRTTTRNTRRHGGGYARVPTGPTTCAFCLMLASRGFVYNTRETAGEFDKYHDDCDCVVVASFDEAQSLVEGYDPDEYLAMYAGARDSIGTAKTAPVLSAMRKMYGLK